MVSIDTISQNAAPPWVLNVTKYSRWILLVLILILIVAIAIAGLVGGIGAAIGAVVAAVAIVVAVNIWLRNIAQQAAVVEDLNPASFTPQSVASASANPGFTVSVAGVAPPAGAAAVPSASRLARNWAVAHVGRLFLELEIVFVQHVSYLFCFFASIARSAPREAGPTARRRCCSAKPFRRPSCRSRCRRKHFR